MLSELSEARQIPGEGFRRWFTDESMDLIVWYTRKGGAVRGVQLCYGKDDPEKGERALTWTEEGGYRHEKVDDGENRGFSHKGTPVLKEDGAFDPASIVQDFKEASTALQEPLRAFVMEILSQYS